MNKTLYLDAGHNAISDPGTITPYGKESDFTIPIRDLLIPELIRNGFEIKTVPDNLNLKDSIAWVNTNSSKLEDGLALAIHLNCCGRFGAESYYYGNSQISKDIAQKLIDGFCEITTLAKIGARSDNVSNIGSLGWIRKTKPYATLIEIGFLDNKDDVEKMKDYGKMASGIMNGICKIFNTNYIPETNPPLADKEGIKKQIIELLNTL